MSTLLLQPPVVEPSPSARPAGRIATATPTAPASAAQPLSHQLGELFRRFGATKMDILIFIVVYGFVVGLTIFASLAGRVGHAPAFQWGIQLMNVPLAAIGLALLALAPLGAATALYMASRSRRRATAVALGIALLGCLGFVATVVADLDAKRHFGIRPAAAFRPNDRYVARQFGVKLPKGQSGKQATKRPAVVAAPLARTVDAGNGRKLFFGTCASCHGYGGQGLPGQGKSLVGNEFINQRDDAAMLAFLKVGRQPWDPLNTTKVQMPPRGGNPRLSDDDLRDIIAYVRSIPAAAGGSATPAAAASATNAGVVSAPSPAEPAAIDMSLILPGWIVPPPPDGPVGISEDFLSERCRPSWRPPADGVAFANSLHLTTELGGLHAGLVAAGLAALLIQTLRGRITPERRAPLALGVTASVVLALSWAVIFPFTYLI